MWPLVAKYSPTGGTAGSRAFEAPQTSPPDAFIQTRRVPNAGRLAAQRQAARGALPAAPPEVLLNRVPDDVANRVSIVGGGPMGLAIAIALRQANFAVTVYELREEDYSRPVHLNLRAETLQVLKELGVYNQLFGDAGPIEQLLFFDKTTGTRTRRAGAALPQGPVPRSASCEAMLRQPSVAQVMLSDLEKTLYAQAQDLGVTVTRGAHVQPIGELTRGTLRVTTQKAGGQSMTSDVQAGVVIVADGANSKTRDSLGIEMEVLPRKACFIAGKLQYDVGKSLTRTVEQANNKAYKRQICVGHASNGKAWVLVEVPADQVEALRADPARATEYYLEYANQVLREVDPSAPRLTRKDLTYSGNTVFDVKEQIATKVVVGGKWVLAGDAVGSSHFLTSGGVNTALRFHLPALEQFAINVRNGQDPTQAAAAVTAELLGATGGWITVGRDEFSDKNPKNFGDAFIQQANRSEAQEHLDFAPPTPPRESARLARRSAQHKRNAQRFASSKFL